MTIKDECLKMFCYWGLNNLLSWYRKQFRQFPYGFPYWPSHIWHFPLFLTLPDMTLISLQAIRVEKSWQQADGTFSQFRHFSEHSVGNPTQINSQTGAKQNIFFYMFDFLFLVSQIYLWISVNKVSVILLHRVFLTYWVS